MENNIYSNIQSQGSGEDKVEKSLRSISEGVIAVVFGLLPLVFLPIVFLPPDYIKVIFTILGIFLAIIFFSLSILRSGSLRIPVPNAMLGLWVVAIIACVSAIFSGDMQDSFLGDAFEVHTAVFLVLVALVGSITSLIRQSKNSIMRLYVLLTASAAVLALFHVSRLFFGPDFLTLGIFTDTVSTSVGSWNDLGLFFGLSILLSLVALEQLPLTKWGKIVFAIGIVLSLLMLMVVNFSAIWFVLALVSLVMLMYSLIKDRFTGQSLSPEGKSSSSLQSILLSLGVFAVSLTFIVAGGPLSNVISSATGISYVEVRPSISATIDIARNVYSENAFFGIGPNKFIDAWRLYKDPSINQTIFWDTDFRGGSGYIPTLFVTTGIFGALSWLLFFGLLLWSGFKMLFKTTHADRSWYFIGSSSFIAAVYLWGMSLFYVPGAIILILAALFSSIMFAAYSELVPTKMLSLSVLQNKRTAIILVGIVMMVVVASASILYFVGRHYSATYTFGNAVTNVKPGVNLKQVEQTVAAAYEIFPNDKFAQQIVRYQLAKMNSLLALPEPSEEQQIEFQNAMITGLNASQKAIADDPTDAVNWSLSATIYSLLVLTGATDVMDRAEEAIANARLYSPSNPSYALLEAQLYLRAGDVAKARTSTLTSINLKPNYTDALYLLTELDISEGKVEDAIATTRLIISIEPNNPARYYQLGILESTRGNIDPAIVAFERAVQLDARYANARYLLALAYAQTGKVDAAVEQLNVVLELNPGNQQVVALIENLKSGEFTIPTTPEVTDQIAEPEAVTESNDNVITTEASDTPLVTSVNAVGEDDGVNEEGQTSDSETVQFEPETSE